ncbi:MAG TPA: cobalamin-independent methionine synthase II family protein [Vicinamibacteria bacterium]|nr:cobalamin-independent methionine synthase II family protein [Vicinamibacteria bacterium]
MERYRADNVGSLLRPAYLHQAREQYASGRIRAREFKAVEDRAVDEAVALQESVGIDVVTDGEMRRDLFLSQLAQSTSGFERLPPTKYLWYRMDGTEDVSTLTYGLTGRLRRKRSLSSEELSYLRARTRRPAKVTVPSPTMFVFYWVPGISDSAYSSIVEFLDDVTNILCDEVEELVRLGARYIQFDAPELGIGLEPRQQNWFASKGFGFERMVPEAVDRINAVIERHNDVTFGLHVCRGNNASRYMGRGSYDAVATTIFRGTRAGRLLLEFDDERSGDFSPLAHVPGDKTVVLGLVTTKTSRMETSSDVEDRIRQASRYVPLDRLALSTQCGFASVAKGNDISPEAQERKLRLVVEVARRVWSD